MDKRTRLTIGAIGVFAVIGLGAGVGVAAGGDDDKPLRGNDLDRATSAALEEVGEGTVVETEIGDDGAAYEAEVRLPDGSQVEIQLDADFNVIGSEADDDSGAADEGGDD